MNRSEKTTLSNTLKDKFQKANVAIFADYKGLSATEADILRRELRTHQAEVKVLKNNVARLAFGDGAFGDDARKMMDSVAGPTLVAFGYNDAVVVAKVLKKFADDHEAFQLKRSLMGKRVIEPTEVEQLSQLPDRNTLLAMLLSTMNGPARGFVSVLAAVPRGLVTALSAIETKKIAAGGGKV